ncbi:MAG: tRNA uridine-5-carboxymethylaminomethyl(34) synthesis GTPase MnmE [Pseudomonadales bacterium]
MDTDTIVALATPPGRGGVGVVRLSGPASLTLASSILGFLPIARHAHYTDFIAYINGEKITIDQGIALFFKGPNSFTGEDVLELQGHGGPVIMDSLIEECLRLGARMARPGEFSERAFLNDKIDLVQAEAIADLIDSSSRQAAKNAVRSLQGEFSRRVNHVVDVLTRLRLYVEAAIDFPEEEIDFLADERVTDQVQEAIDLLKNLLTEAKQGALMREGMTIVIAGRPNAGKSSLLNALAGKETAIVTDVAGTTRDLLREEILVDGMPVHVIDTAGLRDNPDVVEKIGIERALQQIVEADRVLLVVDSVDEPEIDLQRDWQELVGDISLLPEHVTIIRNKCDQSGLPVSLQQGEHTILTLSAKHGEGLELLREHLKTLMGFNAAAEGQFTARRRHLDAIERALEFALQGQFQLQGMGAGELLADDLFQAQKALGEITGKLTADDLLGKIFSSFCIGK